MAAGEYLEGHTSMIRRDPVGVVASIAPWNYPLNCGKPLHCVINDEMPAIADVFRFFAGAARCLPGMAAGEYLEGHTSMIRRDPVGVVASIAPWNYPL
ncbi:aldehyde dehydrogenase family protein, partial [Enterobacter hormaechei]|uniref:aldehyde dehydrogenase family protein n=1 Tax=Enterobacter hormaechei TaxID=158836 RepID=UPI000FCC2D8A